MRRGIVLPQREASRENVAGAARTAEEAGLDSVWASDIVGNQFLEQWSVLTAAAICTDRVSIGTLITKVGRREHGLVLQHACTLNKLSGGRFIAGLGIGDKGPPPRLERVKQMADLLEALNAMDIPVFIGGASKEMISLAARAAGWCHWGSAGSIKLDAGRVRDKNPAVEILWAGQARDLDEDAIVDAGADHVVVAAGSQNYEERIEFAASFRNK